ncbi:MAG: hypothetical protein SXQ77_08170 [Halobacteria archaeon]|nr:hypothetical protein [Halobacteria archaeon]
MGLPNGYFVLFLEIGVVRPYIGIEIQGKRKERYVIRVNVPDKP